MTSARARRAVPALAATLLLLDGCAASPGLLLFQGSVTRAVHGRIALQRDDTPGHLEWWNDLEPRSLLLRQACGGAVPEYRLPGPSPAVHLRLDSTRGEAVFHDDPIACADADTAGPPLRLVVAMDPFALVAPGMAVLQGRLSRNGWVETPGLTSAGAVAVSPRRFESKTPYSVGDPDSLVPGRRFSCASDAWCMHPGALLHWRDAQGWTTTLDVREILHPRASASSWQRRSLSAAGYLVTVPVDVVLAPIYFVGAAGLLVLLAPAGH